MKLLDVEFEIIKKNVKNMTLSVRPPCGKICITAPQDVPDAIIQEFAIGKINWIKQQIEKFQNCYQETELRYVTGETHYLWGRKYKLEVRSAADTKSVAIDGEKIILTVLPLATIEDKKNDMIEWYRKQLKDALPPLFEKWEKVIGVHANEYNVRIMKSRWGSCNVIEKRIWLSLQLAKASLDGLEYVVVHELVHLLEKKHTELFWRYMDKFLPNWRTVKKQLDESLYK